jgi:two-component system sensor histidine kinase MprB
LLISVSVGGLLIAGAAGLLLTRKALSPMERLTRTAEHIARTDDLGTPVDVSGRDEVGRLGRAFTTMTTALSESRRHQRELLTDAAHELRTPLTSLRTNMDLLVRSDHSGRSIPAERRTRMMTSLQAQTREFSDLVDELVVLARDEHELARVRVEMISIIERAVRRAASRTHGHRIDVRTEPWATIGDPSALERTILNVLDNAIKFSPPSSIVTVRSGPGWISVADEGPGIAAEHREQAFDRFWRAADARGLPGSGLGLTIVASTIGIHGGSVRFTDPPAGRGAHVRMELPVSGDA